MYAMIRSFQECIGQTIGTTCHVGVRYKKVKIMSQSPPIFGNLQNSFRNEIWGQYKGSPIIHLMLTKNETKSKNFLGTPYKGGYLDFGL